LYSLELSLHTESEFDFQFHYHEIVEARFILNGELFYDIYNEITKEIIRIHLREGDLLLIPPFCYHRTIKPANIVVVKWIQLFNYDKINYDEIKHTFLKYDTNNIKDVMHQLSTIIKIKEQNKQSNKTKENENLNVTNKSLSPNGISYIMGGRAKALASYPHLRQVEKFLYVSGASSRRPDNTHIGANRNSLGQWVYDIKQQTRAVLENIKIILNQVNCGLENLIECTVFLVDFKDYNGMNEVYNEYFDAETGPTRTTVAVARLPHPNLLIEIQCVAYKP